MSLMKKILLGVVGVVSVIITSAAMAGGPDFAPPAPIYQPYVYIEANVGYAQTDWRRFSVTPFATFGSNSRGGFSFGADIGYMILRELGIEFGWQYLPTVNGATAAVPFFPFTADGSLCLSSWFGYLAAKVSVPIGDSLDLYGKIGAAYRNLRWRDVGAAGISTQGYWRPYWAAGFSYAFNSSWFVAVQYAHLGAYVRATPYARRAPNVSLYTFHVGYSFEV